MPFLWITDSIILNIASSLLGSQKIASRSDCAIEIPINKHINNYYYFNLVDTNADMVQPKHLKGLRVFAEEYPNFDRMIVSWDPINRKTEDGIRIIFIRDFLQELWSGKLF